MTPYKSLETFSFRRPILFCYLYLFVQFQGVNYLIVFLPTVRQTAHVITLSQMRQMWLVYLPIHEWLILYGKCRVKYTIHWVFGEKEHSQVILLEQSQGTTIQVGVARHGIVQERRLVGERTSGEGSRWMTRLENGAKKNRCFLKETYDIQQKTRRNLIST